MHRRTAHLGENEYARDTGGEAYNSSVGKTKQPKKRGICMRYIYYIIFILIALSAAIGYVLSPSHISQKDAALVINDRIITTDEFNALYSARPREAGGKKDFINALITKELLIQESEKEGIDREESFRRSIQSFYEQSLIKLLMDRKLASLRADISDEELDRYFALTGGTVRLTMFSFSNAEEAGKGEYKNGKRMSLHFENLSEDIRSALLRVTEGKMTAPVKCGDSYLVIRLDKVIAPASTITSPQEREKIKEMLSNERREQMIDDWVAGLRKKASIRILVDGKNQGEK
jgi:hypothetical protein